MTAEELRQELVAGLVERGELPEEWRETFLEVPRHHFIPDTVYVHDPSVTGPDLLPLRRQDEPERWLSIAYANAPVNTQVDDGCPDESGRGRELTSSASQPAVVAEMLSALSLEPGMRVLEIGTGTGWNAALLARRAGAGNVVSVEVDPSIAEHARARLTAENLGVVVVTDDGADGWPAGAPYDRVMATVAARTVPHEWISQTRRGGMVLVPWGSEWYPTSLLGLEIGEDSIGRGRIVGSANFMALRAQRTPRWGSTDLVGSGHVVVSTTELHPWHVAGCPDAATAIGFRVSGCRQHYTDRGEGPGRLVMVDQSTASWARLTLSDDRSYKVEQAGRRRLWDEVEAAHRWWLDAEEPTVADWLVTVTADGQSVALG